MIIEPKKISFGFRCNDCYEKVESIGGVFSLSGKKIVLKCRCGKSHLKMDNGNDGKIRFEVPCVYCQSTHTFTISRQTLISKELLTTTCPYCGYEVLFTGEEGKVDEALDTVFNDVLKSFSLEDLDGIKSSNSDEDILDKYDAAIIDEIMVVLDDLEYRHKVHCDCDDDGDYVVEIDSDTSEIVIKCTKCGCEKRISLDNSIDTQSFLDIDELYLVKN